ncbi:MAG: YHS domain-containing protein [Kiritimatiellae bacterium]|nr:YHS domain-containing protein [Kiritimatiellia bacterium]MDD5522523.1 YHS domain-containing protein [Kiritimatiellia bacterium]
MRKIVEILAILALGTIMFGCDQSAGMKSNIQPGVQTTCPVMDGNSIDKKYFADYDGKRIYFCCGSCPAVFKKDPAKYVKKLEDQGVILEKTPVEKEEKTK